MIQMAIDFLRNIGWGIVSLIYNLIDTIYNIIIKINELDIIGTLANNSLFSNIYSAIIVISLTVFGLFVTWQFAKKIIEPDDGPTINQIVTETVKCGILVLISTFLFVQISTFAIQLSGYVSGIITTNTNETLGSALLMNYIEFNSDYKTSEEFENENYKEDITNGSFGKYEKYNDKYVVEDKLFADKKQYKYDIEWILSILCGGFFLYSLVFSAILLAKRQIEFLFIFLLSPIIFATSVCNKQRRGALIEQLVSLTLQASVVILIINITVIIAGAINGTTFFDNTFQNMTMKSILYLGSAIFLLTGSQSINRFIGSNVSANSGREQLMSLMGYGKLARGVGVAGAGLAVGGSILGGAGLVKGGNYVAKKTGLNNAVAKTSNNILKNVGMGIASFGKSFGSAVLPDGSTMSSANPIKRTVQSAGNTIRNHGLNLYNSANQNEIKRAEIPTLNEKISQTTGTMMRAGAGIMIPVQRIPFANRINTNPYLYRKPRKKV